MNVLFVDDQWCRPEKQGIIRNAFGELEQRETPWIFHYETAEDGSGGYGVRPVLDRIASIGDVRAVVLDVLFGQRSHRLGLDILEAIRRQYPLLPVFIMTSVEDQIDVIEAAMERGANEYLIKKPTLREMETALRTYTDLQAPEADHALWGNSPAIRGVRAMIARVAVGGSASVLITGESGTGKELAARAIHRQGPRRNKPFVAKNCAYDDSSLLDSDLFGHEPGAFTGANRRHVGRVERANDGILFLDEIGGITPSLQGKLLRVLETKEFERLGGSETLRSNFQLICATNEDPAVLCKEGRLRKDLFFRIGQVEIHMPPLCERVEDVSLLAELFLKRFKAGTGASYVAERFSAEVLDRLAAYPWPGNVRELKNVVERAVMLARNPVIDLEALPRQSREDRTVLPEPSSGRDGLLPDDPALWARSRIVSELRMAVEARSRCRSAAEFMRRMYPGQSKTSTAAVKDLVRLLTTTPWGDPKLLEDPEIAGLIEKLR